MHLLDTDTLSAFIRGDATVRTRIRSTPADEIWISSVAVEELLRGYLAEVAREPRKRSAPNWDVVSGGLIEVIRVLGEFNILPYDDRAEEHYRRFDAAIRRIGRTDCRVAASAIVHQMTVVSRNVRDFARIPGVAVEDWSRPPAADQIG